MIYVLLEVWQSLLYLVLRKKRTICPTNQSIELFIACLGLQEDFSFYNYIWNNIGHVYIAKNDVSLSIENPELLVRRLVYIAGNYVHICTQYHNLASVNWSS